MQKRSHLNGRTIGFCSYTQTQKLEQHYMSPLLILGVKGLKSLREIIKHESLAIKL